MSKAAEFQFTSLHSVTKEQAVYDRLRRAITSGDLAPGQRLIPAEIASQFQVSNMPVRNALMRLEAEHLVARAPHKEFVVNHYTPREIEELYAVRAVLNGYAARLAAQNMTASKLEELQQLQARAEEFLAEGDRESLMEVNQRFLEVLYAQSGNEKLIQIIGSLADMAIGYRSSYYASPGIPEVGTRSHAEIVAALVRGEPDTVEKVVTEGIDHACATLLRLHGTRANS